MISAFILAAAEPKLDCADPQDQSSMNMCAERDFERADAEMNAQWRLTVAAERAADKDVDRKYDRQPLAYDTLLAAQRAWLTFRDQQCLLASFYARGGSMQPMLESGCKAELTKARTKQLKSLVEDGN
jgi:uncharacterized protein YecT (DUF1311 family)